MTLTTKLATLAVALAVLGGPAAGPALGAGSGGSSNDASSGGGQPGELRQARDHIEAGNFADAVPLLKRVVAENPKNADAHNWLGYAYRTMGDFAKSKEHYDEALAIDPEHRGAHEYLGELYLQMGDLDRAEQQLARLDELCFFGCDEYDDLEAAIAAYKDGRQSSSAW